MPRTILIGIALACAACSTSTPPASAPKPATTATPIAGRNPAPDDSGDWIRPAKDYASTRFSSLQQVTVDSVTRLGVRATFSTGLARGHEAAPLVVNGTMYIVTPYPNILYALDLGAPGVPLKWKYEPKPIASAQGVACCDVVNRGAVYSDGAIFYNTLDNRMVAIDAATGAERWVATLGD